MNVLMPQLGETFTEGTILQWYKRVGDAVAAGDLLFDVETDKTSMEVPAVIAGVLREIRAQSGDVIAVGEVVAVIGEAGEAAAVADEATSEKPRIEANDENAADGVKVMKDSDAGQAPVVAAAAAGAPVAPPQKMRATALPPIDPFHGVRTPEKNYGHATLPSGAKTTPLARRLAAERGIDLSHVQGSGPRDRIVAADVRRARAGAEPAAAGIAPAENTEQILSFYAGTDYREIPLNGMRKTVARRLTESKQQVPHFYVSGEFNADALLALRKQINADGNVRVSVNDLMVKAYALALQQVPAANVAWAGDRLLQFERSDIGVAVAMPGGLVTPIVRSADTKSLAELSTELAGLITRARERKLQAAEYTGGGATVSNLGMYGVRSFQAIVNPPQATILALGAAERRPIAAEDGSLRAAMMLSVSISVDHRVVDGATAGELLAALRRLVESPIGILI